MEIRIENNQRKIPLNLTQIKKTIKAILRRERITKASLACVFVTRQKIQALNRKYRKRSYATDVLAFENEGPGLNGDIIISTDAALKQAKEFGTTRAYELGLYIVHGILHLKGYDDHSLKDRAKMNKKEQVLLEYLGKQIDKITK